MALANRPLLIAGREFGSRLLVGTGKFSSPEMMRDALAAAFRAAVVAGRAAFEMGLGAPLDTASPTSPLTAFLDQV